MKIILGGYFEVKYFKKIFVFAYEGQKNLIKKSKKMNFFSLFKLIEVFVIRVI